MIDIANGEDRDPTPFPEGKDPGRCVPMMPWGLKGGVARADGRLISPVAVALRQEH
jgi:hypothetical protein